MNMKKDEDGEFCSETTLIFTVFIIIIEEMIKCDMTTWLLPDAVKSWFLFLSTTKSKITPSNNDK